MFLGGLSEGCGCHQQDGGQCQKGFHDFLRVKKGAVGRGKLLVILKAVKVGLAGNRFP
jgi:hypothetical protein